MPEVHEVLVNGRWPLRLPEHRAARPEWPWWEATRLAAMATVVGPGALVYDIGAEEGDFPALYASWGAEVVLAEPNRRVWPNIRLIWEANGLPRPVASFVGFVADEGTPGRLSSLLPAGDWPACAYGPVIGDHGFCQLGDDPDIETITVDQLAEALDMPPTVLTLDVEGAELHVLRGASQVLSGARPDVFVSIHPEAMLDRYGIRNGVDAVRSTMGAHGYSETFLGFDHEHHWWFRP